MVASLALDKSPVLVGFTRGFFKALWPETKRGVLDSIGDFFNGKGSSKHINSNTKTFEFPPISCVNTIYKIVSKLLASRLAEVMPELVSLNQSAFVEGRLISDNILLAEELLRGFSQKNIARRVCVSLDLSKAFDFASWRGIKITLWYMNFSGAFIQMIMQCIDTASFCC